MTTSCNNDNNHFGTLYSCVSGKWQMSEMCKNSNDELVSCLENACGECLDYEMKCMFDISSSINDIKDSSEGYSKNDVNSDSFAICYGGKWETYEYNCKNLNGFSCIPNENKKDSCVGTKPVNTALVNCLTGSTTMLKPSFVFTNKYYLNYDEKSEKMIMILQRNLYT